MSLQKTLGRFRVSVAGEPQVVEIPLTKCAICGQEFAGLSCPGCGWTEQKKGEKAKELSPLQRLVKSLRTSHNVVVKSVDWSADLQTCLYCGSQFSKELQVCPRCNKKVADSKTRFIGSVVK